MNLIFVINLLEACSITVALMGVALFRHVPAYRGVSGLLLFVVFASLVNVVENQGFSKTWYLISPVFVMGFGPAFYFATKRMVQGPIGKSALLHFVPMLLLLPFTHDPQLVIAIGTIGRVIYTVMSVRLIYVFNRQSIEQRSDALDVSLTWLGWLFVILAVFNAIDLLRLNFQPQLGVQLNFIGYALSTLVSAIMLFFMVVVLNDKRELLGSVAGVLKTPGVDQATCAEEESAQTYTGLYQVLQDNMTSEKWYCKPRLTLAQLSELSGINSRDVSRSINLVAGMPFNDYINQFRVEHVKANMLSANTNLLDLAYAAGFSSKATFNQAFKKVTGVTPSEYRRSMLDDKVQDHDLKGTGS